MKTHSQFSHKPTKRRYCFEATEPNSFTDDDHSIRDYFFGSFGKITSFLLFRENDYFLFLLGAVLSDTELKKLPDLLFIQIGAVLTSRKLKVTIH
jgi:hypothetical protein